MNFEAYWEQLVHRVCKQHEFLSGKEDLFYRWSCIYGEAMIDGIEAYFERRFADFDADMEALRLARFDDVYLGFQTSRVLLFGNVPLEEMVVRNRIAEMLMEYEKVHSILSELDEIYRRLIPRLIELDEYKYQFGLREELYSVESKPEAFTRPGNYPA